MSSAIETGDRALTETKMMPMRERQVVDIVHIDVHSPCGDFVQQRLPNVRRELIDQRDFGRAFSRKLVAQRTRQRQPTRTAADDDDSVLCCLYHFLPTASVARLSASTCDLSAK